MSIIGGTVHICTHPSGQSHVCQCGLIKHAHSSVQTACMRYSETPFPASPAEPEPLEQAPLITEFHNFEGEVGFKCKRCGMELEHPNHPHTSVGWPRCTCGLRASSLCHQMTKI
jgi:hypothetical protein